MGWAAAELLESALVARVRRGREPLRHPGLLLPRGPRHSRVGGRFGERRQRSDARGSVNREMTSRSLRSYASTPKSASPGRRRVHATASGNWIEPRNINRMFKRLYGKAQVPRVRVHDLRHSCATLLFTMGVEAATVQRILRHSSITVTTGTYVEVIESVQRDAIDTMGEFFDLEDDLDESAG